MEKDQNQEFLNNIYYHKLEFYRRLNYEYVRLGKTRNRVS